MDMAAWVPRLLALLIGSICAKHAMHARAQSLRRQQAPTITKDTLGLSAVSEQGHGRHAFPVGIEGGGNAIDQFEGQQELFPSRSDDNDGHGHSGDDVEHGSRSVQPTVQPVDEEAYSAPTPCPSTGDPTAMPTAEPSKISTVPSQVKDPVGGLYSASSITLAPIVTQYPTASQFPTWYNSHLPTGPTATPATAAPTIFGNNLLSGSGIPTSAPTNRPKTAHPTASRTKKPKTLKPT